MKFENTSVFKEEYYEKTLGTIFPIMGLLQIIVLSAVSTFDKVVYSDQNHFIGFMNSFNLRSFFLGAALLIGIVILLLILNDKQQVFFVAI